MKETSANVASAAVELSIACAVATALGRAGATKRVWLNELEVAVLQRVDTRLGCMNV